MSETVLMFWPSQLWLAGSAHRILFMYNDTFGMYVLWMYVIGVALYLSTRGLMSRSRPLSQDMSHAARALAWPVRSDSAGAALAFNGMPRGRPSLCLLSFWEPPQRQLPISLLILENGRTPGKLQTVLFFRVSRRKLINPIFPITSERHAATIHLACDLRGRACPHP